MFGYARLAAEEHQVFKGKFTTAQIPSLVPSLPPVPSPPFPSLPFLPLPSLPPPLPLLAGGSGESPPGKFVELEMLVREF